MSLPRFLLFDYCFSLLCNEGLTAQQSYPADFPAQFECALYAELDESGAFNGKFDWQYYLRQFDPHCADCNLRRSGRTADAQQAATESTKTDHGDCAELDCKKFFSLRTTVCDFRLLW